MRFIRLVPFVALLGLTWFVSVQANAAESQAAVSASSAPLATPATPTTAAQTPAADKMLIEKSDAAVSTANTDISSTDSAATTLDVDAFATVVIQHHGRIKPLDTFARMTLLGMSEKQSTAKQSALEWLLTALLDRQQALQQKTFTIRSPGVLRALGAEVDSSGRYSLNDLREPMMKHESLIQALQGRDESLLDETEAQLVQKYQQASEYLGMTHSLSCFWPDIQVTDARIARAFAIAPGSRHSYFFYATQKQVLSDVLTASFKAKKADPDYDDSGIAALWQQMRERLEHQSATSLTIIPPAVVAVDAASEAKLSNTARQAAAKKRGLWRSPWNLLDGTPLEGDDLAQMSALNNAVIAYTAADQAGFNQALAEFKQLVGHDSKIAMEVSYNKADYFYRSLYFYIAAFLCLSVFWLTRGHRWYQGSVALLAAGAALHLTGVVLRIIIMERPPVSTLYESVIFASLIAVLFGLAIELWRKDTWALLTAVLIGISLQFIGFSFAAEGDTMGMLQAVLNSVFWLATHVVTIIIGYGASLVAGILGHILLARYIWRPLEKKANQELFKTARGVALVALFFTTLGTILGGIWADQSWGRFWGWDPKENGAMLIVLWLLIAIHGFISGELKQIGFAMFLAMTNICVALAWFGVNLLSVGLHSYGFNNKTAVALCTFCALEAVIILSATWWAMYKRRSMQELKTSKR